MDLATAVTFGLGFPLCWGIAWYAPHGAISDSHGAMGRVFLPAMKVLFYLLFAGSLTVFIWAIWDGFILHVLLFGGTSIALGVGTWHAIALRRARGVDPPVRLDSIQYLGLTGLIVFLHGTLVYLHHSLDFGIPEGVSGLDRAVFELPFTVVFMVLGFFTASSAVKVLARGLNLDEGRETAHSGAGEVPTPSRLPPAIAPTLRRQYVLVAVPVVICLLISLFSWALLLGTGWRLVVLWHGWVKKEPPSRQFRLIPASMQPRRRGDRKRIRRGMSRSG